jgi:uncharacterized protein YeaO (DUF488 family)
MRLARIYDPPQPGDGARILVDRLWPRGIRRDDPRIDRWCKGVAPSSELRRWYHHDPDRHDVFVARYQRELETPPAAAALDELRMLVKDAPATLLTSAKDVEHGHLPVLARLLEHRG